MIAAARTPERDRSLSAALIGVMIGAGSLVLLWLFGVVGRLVDSWPSPGGRGAGDLLGGGPAQTLMDLLTGSLELTPTGALLAQTLAWFFGAVTLLVAVVRGAVWAWGRARG